MHRSSESNRQDWLPPASLGSWPSDGCDAPICLPNPTVRIVLHLFGPWPSDGSDAPISPNPTAKDWLLRLHACIFWSLPKWRLRCTNSSKTNRQDVRTCDKGSAIYILHRLYWRRKTHFHPPSLNFVPCRQITFTYLPDKNWSKTYLPIHPQLYHTEFYPQFTRGTGICFEGIRHPHFTRGTGICFLGIRHPHFTRRDGYLLEGIRHPHFTQGTGICFEVSTTKAIICKIYFLSFFPLDICIYKGMGICFEVGKKKGIWKILLYI
jgi:hypothetical protein